MYHHQWVQGTEVKTSLPVGKVVCVGRNYAAHARELNNPVPTEPVLFIKPSTTLVPFEHEFSIPEDDCHYEAELAVLIAEPLTGATVSQVSQAIAGYGLALDLTKRKLQSKLKEKSLPWELAKSFDGACPITAFAPKKFFTEGQNIEFDFFIDGEQRQKGLSQNMLNPVEELVAHISAHFTLLPGDIVITGTPEGVGELHPGQQLSLILDNRFEFGASVAGN